MSSATRPNSPFHDLLDPATVNQVLDKNQVSFRDRIFSPLVTLWTFLSQVLSLDHSCREAVARLIAFRVSNGQEPCGPETGSYCKARQRLLLKVITDLVQGTAQRLQEQAPDSWLWKLIITHNYSRSLLPAWKPATSKVRS